MKLRTVSMITGAAILLVWVSGCASSSTLRPAGQAEETNAQVDAYLATAKFPSPDGRSATPPNRKNKAVSPAPAVLIPKEKMKKEVAEIKQANTCLLQGEKEKEPKARAAHLEKAQAHIAALRKITPDSPFADLLEGKVALIERNLPKAIKEFEIADKGFEGQNPEPVFLSGLALSEAGETGAAISHFERLMKTKNLPPDATVKASLQLAQLYLRVGRLQKAETAVDKVLAQSPEDEQALLIKSQILARKASASAVIK